MNSGRVIPLRRRQDLIATRAQNGWTIKDPLSLEYFRLDEREFTILNALDGACTFQGLQESLRRHFPDVKFAPEVITGFLGRLLTSGLAISTVSGTATQQLTRHQSIQRLSRWRRIFSLFSLRLRGFNPTPLLQVSSGVIRFALSPSVLIVALATMLTAAGMVILRFEEIVARLPSLDLLATPQNALLMAGLWLGIKLLHELGHAAVCHHFGGTCHDVGVMFLVFVPLFYCDVSDAWMLADRKQRMAISFAGIFVELFLAAVFTLLWWFSYPGLFNTLCLNAMLVCSVSTVLFNGNPLLRYDGYHVLADAVDIPNLAAQGNQVVGQTLDRIVLGQRMESVLRRFPFLLCYGIAAAVYRMFVTLAIAWFLVSMFRGFELQVVGQSLASLLCLGTVLPLGMGLVSRFQHVKKIHTNSNRTTNASKTRIVAGIVCSVIVIAGLLFIPLPFSVSAPFVVMPAQSETVFATVPGHSSQFRKHGSAVAANETVLQLSNTAIDRDVIHQSTRVNRLEKHLEYLHAIRDTNSAAAFELATTNDELAAARNLLRLATERKNELTIRSPQSGTILPARNVPDLTSTGGKSRWVDSLLSQKSVGAFVASGTPVCVIGDTSRMYADVYADETIVSSIVSAAECRLVFQSAPGRSVTGQVESIVAVNSKTDIPRELIFNNRALENPATRFYRIHVSIPAGNDTPTLYSTGTARIASQARSIWARVQHTIRQTFGRL